MARGKIYIGFVVGITPNVVTHSCVHKLLRRKEVLFVPLNLVSKGGLGNCDSDFILFTTLLRRRRRRLSAKRSNITECSLPKILVSSSSAIAKLNELLLGDIDAWVTPTSSGRSDDLRDFISATKGCSPF